MGTSELSLQRLHFLKDVHVSQEGNIGGYTSKATSGQMAITSETRLRVKGSSGCNNSKATSGKITPITSERRKTPEGSSGHSPCDCPRGHQSNMQVLETSTNAEFGHMSMPEWARKPAELRSPGHFRQILRSVEESGQKLRMSDSGSCEEHDEYISGQV